MGRQLDAITRLFGVLGHGAGAALLALASWYCYRDGDNKAAAGLPLMCALAVAGRLRPVLMAGRPDGTLPVSGGRGSARRLRLERALDRPGGRR